MDTRRLVLLCIFFFSAYLLWQNWLYYKNPPKAPTAAAQSGTVQPNAALMNDAPSASQTFKGESNGELPLTPLDEVDASATHFEKNSTLTVETDLYRATISLEGGSLVDLFLKNYQEQNDPTQPYHYFDPKRHYAAQSGLIGNNLPTHKTLFKRIDSESLTLADGQNQIRLVLEAQTPSNLKVRKILTFTKGDYRIQTAWQIENLSDAPLTNLQAYYQLLRDNSAPEGERFMSTFTGPAIYTDEDKYQKIDFSDIADNSAKFTKTANNGWLALVQHYFVAAWVPQSNVAREFYMKKLDNSNVFRAGFITPINPLKAGEKAQIEMPLYVGPQVQSRLEKLHPQLPLVVDYGWLTMIAAPIFWLLEAIYSLVGNWGWSIIVLTVLIKAVFFPLSAASYKSMAKMRVITPRLTQIRERYANDRAAMNREMMNLYQTEKINPLGGCLPILVQIPVFIALYWVLLGAVEMRGAPWLGWITDLAAPDPYFILPIIMIASMVLQMKLNPAPTDPVQAKVMMIMPFAFGIMFLFFPSGLVLYWVVNNILSIAQQWHITRHYEHLAKPPKAANDS